MPKHGYTRMFEAMLASPNIDVMLGTDYRDVKDEIPHRRLIFTGPVDEFFGFRFGHLPYRSLRFKHVTLDQPWFQPVGTVNFPQTEDYTRISEYKHMTGQDHPKPGREREALRPMKAEDRVRILKAIATGRAWMQELATSRITSTDAIALRESLSERSVRMTLSLAQLSPGIVRAIVEGRLPRGLGIRDLADLPPSWAEQERALGM
jgi:UDP-galactopyranose mutase